MTAALLCGCSLVQQHSQDKQSDGKEEEGKIPAMPAPLHLGAVHQVYPDKNFCLLRMLGPKPRPGTTLISHPADGSSDRIGNLCVANSQGSRNGMLIADIRSGTVVKGDRVFLYRSIAAPDPAEEEDVAIEEAPAAPSTNEEETLLELPAEEPAPLASTPTEQPSTETDVLPQEQLNIPAEPSASSERLNDIPENISDWDNM